MDDDDKDEAHILEFLRGLSERAGIAFKDVEDLGLKLKVLLDEEAFNIARRSAWSIEHDLDDDCQCGTCAEVEALRERYA